MPITAKLPRPSWRACTIAGSGIDAGSGTVRSPRPLIVTMPFPVETEVDEGAGARVEVVEEEVDEEVEEETVGALVEVVLSPAASVGVLGSEHAAPNAIEAATSATMAARCLLRSR